MTSDEDEEEISTSEWLRQSRYADEHPAFEGNVEFDLAISFLGQTVTRKARAEYKFTPDWEFFDLHKKALNTVHHCSQVGFSILCEPGEDMGDPPSEEDVAEGYEEEDPEPPTWEHFDLAEDGILTRAAWDAVYDLIEETCKKEDQRRRQEAGL